MTHFFSSVLLMGLAITIARTVSGTAGSDLFDLWKIGIPHVSLDTDNNTITMNYQISESMTSDNIRAEIFTERCEYPLLTEGILSESFDAKGEHVFRIDPRVLVRNPEVYKANYQLLTANMTFCLKYMLWSGPESDEGSLLINYVESILTVQFSLKAGVFLGFSVEPKERYGDRNNATDREGYTADGYLCDPDTYERVELPEGGFLQGEMISVCGELGEIAIRDGLYLKGISNFLWVREHWIGDELVKTEQYSVKDGQAADGLTQYECITANFCTFNTMLASEFYRTPGFIYGTGRVAFDFIALADKETQEKFGYTGRKLRSLQQQDASSDPKPDLQISVPVGRSRPKLLKTAGGVTRNLLFCVVCSVASSLLLIVL